jgi:hypothetical protein
MVATESGVREYEDPELQVAGCGGNPYLTRRDPTQAVRGRRGHGLLRFRRVRETRSSAA